ncbi:hypothetical protein LINPERHAP1_LOCUS17648, partial [Linum perenne]
MARIPGQLIWGVVKRNNVTVSSSNNSTKAMPASASARRARMIRCGKQGNCFYPGRRQGFGSGAVHHEDQKLEQ